MKIKILFAWYDLWIGAYVDRKNRTLYVFPIPMLGVKITFNEKKGISDREISNMAMKNGSKFPGI